MATFFFHCSWQVLQPAVPFIHVLSCPCNSCCLPVVQQLHPRVCTAQALLASSGLLQPLHIPHGPWDSVSTDFVTGLPKTKAGYDAILVFVDRLTKYVHIVPTRTVCTAKTCSSSMCSPIMAFPWKSFLTEVHSLLASRTKRSLIACASHGTCQQHFTLRLMVKQSA